MENMSENVLDVLNRIETTPKSDISTKPKKITKKKIQNASFFSFIRLLILPSQIELKEHSIRVKDPGSEIFSMKQKHQFSRVFSPSATDFAFFSKSLENFTNNTFLIIGVFGSLDIRRLFNYLNFNSYYIFEFDFEILGKLIQNNVDFSNEQVMPISDVSSSTYVTPKIHYLTNGEDRRNITIYIPEGYSSIIRTLKQMANDDHNLTITLLSQINEQHKDKYNSIISLLSLSSKSLVTPKSKTDAENRIKSKLLDNSLKQKQKNAIDKSKNELVISSNDEESDTNISTNITSLKQENSDINTDNLIQTQILNNENKNQIKATSNNDENNLLLSHKENLKVEKKPTNIQENCSQASFLKQMMQNTSSSPNELSGIFDTLGSIIKRSENGWKQTDSELIKLQSRLSLMKTEQTKEAEVLRTSEENLERLQMKLSEMKKHRIDLLNEKDKLNSYVTRSISITTRMKKQVREVVDRSSSYEKKFDEVTKEILNNMDFEVSEKIQSHEILAEMAVLESEIEDHFVST